MTDLQYRICEDAKKLSHQDFLLSVVCDDVKRVSNVLHTTTSCRGNNIDASEPYMFESCQFDYDNCIVKIKANQFDFYPVFNGEDFCKFFNHTVVDWDDNGIVVVSHKFKMMNLFYVQELDDSHICYIYDPRHLNPINQIFYFDLSPCGLHVGYRHLFRDRLQILGIFADIESYFRYKQYEKRIINNRQISHNLQYIDERRRDIDRIKKEIDEMYEANDRLSHLTDAFDLDINKARVEYDMMNM